MHTCKTCGKEFETKRALKIHKTMTKTEKSTSKPLTITAPVDDIKRWKQLAKKMDLNLSRLIRETMFNEINGKNVSLFEHKRIIEENERLRNQLVLLDGSTTTDTIDNIIEKKQERNEWEKQKEEMINDLPEWVSPEDASSIIEMRKQQQEAYMEEYKDLEKLREQFKKLNVKQKQEVKRLMVFESRGLEEAMGGVLNG